MKIVNALSAGSSLGTPATVEKPFGGLLFLMTMSEDNLQLLMEKLQGRGLVAETPVFTSTRAFFDYCVENTGTITASYQRKTGNREQIFNSMKIFTLLEYAQSGGGVISIEKSSLDNSGKLRAFIPIGNVGAMPFNSDELFSLEMTHGEDSMFDDITVYTIETPVVAGSYNKFEKLDVMAGQTEKDLAVSGFHNVMVPIDAITDSTLLTFNWSNGNNTTYNREQLYAMGLLQNDIAINIAGIVHSGYATHAIIDVSQCTNIEVRRDSTSAFTVIAVREVMLPDPGKAIESVANLKLTM